VTVALGQLAVAPETRYSRAGTVKLAFPAPNAQYTVPAGLGALLSPVDGVGSAQTRPTCSSGQTPDLVSCTATDGMAGRLYPKAYVAYAGTCLPTSGGTSVTPVVTGSVPTTTVPLGAAYLKVPNTVGGVVVGTVGTGTVKLTAIHAATSSCSGQTVELAAGVTPSSTTVVRYALPVGDWTIRVTNSLGATKDNAVTLTAAVPGTPTTVTGP
jgi:hypothetical protein